MTVFAKAYYDMIGYFSQMQAVSLPANISSSHFASAINLGGVGDPYYYANTGTKASCAKSFILVLTDGNANGAWNANSVTGYDASVGWNDSIPYQPLGNAYPQFSASMLIAHTLDLRPDLPGNQTVSTYLVQMFAQFLPNVPELETGAQAGGFNNSSGGNKPDANTAPWASLGKTYPGSTVVNPVPDNYFLATDGAQIETQVMSAINALLKQAASATAVSVLATSANGAGSIYQAFFVPSRTVSIAVGSVTSTSTTTFTTTGMSTSVTTSFSTGVSTSKTTSVVYSTTTNTSVSVGAPYTTSTASTTKTTTSVSTGAPYTTSTASTTSTSFTTQSGTTTSTSTGANDNTFMNHCPTGHTCTNNGGTGNGNNTVWIEYDGHPTNTETDTRTGTPYTTSTASTTTTTLSVSTGTPYTTSVTSSTSTGYSYTTSLGTSVTTSMATSTSSSYATSTSSSVTTGTGINLNAITSFSALDLVWLGDLMQLTVDSNGSLRDNQGQCIGFSYDAANFVTNVNWFALGANNVCQTSSPSSTTSLLSFTGYNWNSGPQLTTATPASRTIFTAIGGSTVQFTTTNSSTLCQYMNVDTFSTCSSSHTNTENLINWVRGSSVTGMRDRSFDAAGNQYKLGDILHSTPSIVGAPQENYNLLYRDTGYATYYNSNVTRQRVVYVGANDGMLHAFDAGSYSSGSFSNGTGNELWAYVPYNLLPHLQWLSDPTYGMGGSHISYVDSKVKITDVNFGSVSTPNWKTVLIGAMRLGGGEINKGNNSTDSSQSFRSSYFALDVTNPTSPQFLWEVNASNWGASYSSTPDALGFTMSYPAVANVGTCFYAVVGSGPKDSYAPDYNGNSNQNGSVFIININDCAATGASKGSVTRFQSPDSYSYFSDPIAVDLTLNPKKQVFSSGSAISGTQSYGTDAIYIGETISTSATTPNPNGTALSSKMWRLITNNDVNPASWKFGVLYTDPGGSPISAAPAASNDPQGNIWVFWGTGRALSAADKIDIQTQYFYGVKDPCWIVSTHTFGTSTSCPSLTSPLASSAASVTSSQLLNVGGAAVTTTGAVTGVGTSNTFNKLQTTIQSSYQGWYIPLSSLLLNNSATERVITKPTVMSGLVLFNSFIPNNSDPCSQNGGSYTYAVYYQTGTATPVSTIGTKTVGGVTTVLSRTTNYAVGMASNIALHAGTEKGVTAFIQMSTGEVITISAIPPFSAKSGIVTWREL